MSKSPFIEGLRIAKSVTTPIRVVMNPLSVPLKPLRKLTRSLVTPITDFVIDEAGKAMGVSKKTRELAKAIVNGAVDVTTGAVIGGAVFDEDTWDAAIELLEILNQPGADGSYAWSPT